MVERHWLAVFTPGTWEEFVTAGATLCGFRRKRYSTVQKIQLGDYLLCYVTDLSRWVGLLLADGEAHIDDSRIWKEEIFPCRLGVKPLVILRPEMGIPINDLRDALSWFDNLPSPTAWTSWVRTSPRLLRTQDALVIRRALEMAAARLASEASDG